MDAVTFVRAAVAVAIVAGIAGCGGSSHRKAASTAATTTTAAKPVNAEPEGKISAAEYRAMRAAYRIVRPVARSHDVTRTIRAGQRACVRLTTQTELLAAIHADCVQTMRFLLAARALSTRKAECTKAAQAGDVSCYAELFRSLGRSARVESVRARHVNAVVRKRGLRGACARALGTSKRDLAKTRAIVHDALGSAHALEARNQTTFARAANGLSADLQALDHGNSAAGSLRRVRSCL